MSTTAKGTRRTPGRRAAGSTRAASTPSGAGAASGDRAARAAPEIVPLTPERWGDLEALFGPRGACAGCWCMFWRLRAKDWAAASGARNRAAFEALVRAGPPPGLIAYLGGEPTGWVAVGPREAYPRIELSRKLPRFDDRPTWSVNCFFVDRHARRTGLTRAMLDAAVAWARAHGARVVEGYPVDAAGKTRAPDWLYKGTVRTFRAAGFRKRRRTIGGTPFARYVREVG